MKTYTYPQETWSAVKCAKLAKRRLRDSCGTLHPFPGLIAGSASSYPEYGQTRRFNGGVVIEAEWYQAVSRPLPVIPSSFRFVTRISWGTYLESVPVAV